MKLGAKLKEILEKVEVDLKSKLKPKPKNMLSMDFGARSVKLVEGKIKKGKLEIEKTYVLGLSDGVYEDGYIKDYNILKETIDSFIKLKDIKTNEVAAVVNSSDILIRDVIVPNLSVEEIEGLLKYKITDYIPIDPEEYIVQYINQGIFLEDEVEKLKLFIVAMPKSMVEEHFNLLRDMGLKPVSLDFQSNAIRKLLSFNAAIKKDPIIQGKTVTSIDIGFFSTKLTIIKDSQLEISRVVPLGIRNVFENIDRSTDLTEREILNIAYGSKDEYGRALEFEEKIEIDAALNSFLSRFFDSLEMIFRYYNSQELGNAVDLILLQGDISNVDEVREKCEDYLNIETLGIDSLEGVLGKNLHLYSNALGGLVRGEDI